MEELDLQIGREYNVELYPQGNLVKGRFLGYSDNYNLFYVNDSNKIIAGLRANMIWQGNVLTYSPIHSTSINLFPVEETDWLPKKDQSQLLNLIKNDHKN